MIENNMQRKRSRRRSIVPSNSLRGHFFALARQIRRWSEADGNLCVGRSTSIGVTSLERGVGSSTVSFNLTCSLASLCRTQTLLVEADFGHSFVAKRLGHEKALGLSELLAGEATEHETVFKTPITDVSVIGCGQKIEHEALELPFDAIEPMLKETFAEFSYSVFDLPLASDLTACHSIIPYLDGVILTVDSNFIDQRRVARFKRQVEGYGVPVLGIVLNKS